MLEESDKTLSGTPRVIFNATQSRISAPLHGGIASFDAQKWQDVQAQMDARGKHQRGVRRAKDPAKYPLGCRVFDLTDGCGSVMYGVTIANRPVYRCGRYMRTAGSQCSQNTADGEALLSFVLQLLVQSIGPFGGRDLLQKRLTEIAQADCEQSGTASRPGSGALQNQVVQLKSQLRTAERRMVIEEDDSRYEVLARHGKEIQDELHDAESRLAESKRLQRNQRSPDDEVVAALGLFDEIARVATDREARADVPALLESLQLRIGLTFGTGIKGKKRNVQRLLGGVVAFGDTPLPVPIHGFDNREQRELTTVHNHHEQLIDLTACRCEHADSSLSAAGDGDPLQSGMADDRQPEGISLTKANRGDWTPIELFRDYINDWAATARRLPRTCLQM
jgi:hypothetical protein